MTDQQLMQEVAAGDSDASAILVKRFGRRVYKFLLGWVGNEEDAWDITQEVMVRICRKASYYNGKAALASWVFAVAKNYYFDFRRKKNFRVYENSISFENTAEAAREANRSPEISMMRVEILEKVEAAIETLPPRQREVIQLRLLAELSLEEISEAVGLTLGGVKSTLHNAFGSLRERLIDLKRDAYVNLR